MKIFKTSYEDWQLLYLYLIEFQYNLLQFITYKKAAVGLNPWRRLERKSLGFLQFNQKAGLWSVNLKVTTKYTKNLQYWLYK